GTRQHDDAMVEGARPVTGKRLQPRRNFAVNSGDRDAWEFLSLARASQQRTGAPIGAPARTSVKIFPTVNYLALQPPIPLIILQIWYIQPSISASWAFHRPFAVTRTNRKPLAKH